MTTILLAAAPAGAVVKRTSYSLGSYTVGLVSAYYCSGVVIARRAVVTAAHCGRGMRVIAAGRSFHVRHVGRSAVLDDGRRVQVRSGAAILELAESLPANIAAAPVGEGAGDSFTIAGYGTTTSERERWRGRFGALHEAHLVSAGDNVLVDPNRSGNINAQRLFRRFRRAGAARRHASRRHHARRASLPAHRLRRSDSLGTDPHYRRGRSRGRDGRAAGRGKGAPASPSPPHAPGRKRRGLTPTLKG